MVRGRNERDNGPKGRLELCELRAPRVPAFLLLDLPLRSVEPWPETALQPGPDDRAGTAPCYRGWRPVPRREGTTRPKHRGAAPGAHGRRVQARAGATRAGCWTLDQAV